MIKSLCIILGTFGPVEECSANFEIKKQQTPIQEEYLKEVLSQTYLEVFDKPASKNTVNMAWSQIALENGKGKLVYNYNLGNIGAHVNHATRAYYKVASSRFRSFLSFHEGARNYWKVIKNRCRGALTYFHAGNVKHSAIMLKNCGYYELDVDAYYLSMNDLFVQTSRIKNK